MCSSDLGLLVHQAGYRCVAAGVAGSLAVETGEIADRICERAALADRVLGLAKLRRSNAGLQVAAISPLARRPLCMNARL